jgi:hypothetical protein
MWDVNEMMEMRGIVEEAWHGINEGCKGEQK